MKRALITLFMIAFGASLIFVLTTYSEAGDKISAVSSNVSGCAVPAGSEDHLKLSPDVTQKPVRGGDPVGVAVDAPACARGQTVEEFDEALALARKGDISSIRLVLGFLNMNLEPVGLGEFPRRWIGNRMRGVNFDEYQRFLYRSFDDGDCSSLLVLVELEGLTVIDLNEEIANKLFEEKKCNNDLFSRSNWAQEMKARGWRDLR